MKGNERTLLLMLAAEQHWKPYWQQGQWPRTLWANSGVPAKRQHYLQIKWSDKGWYDYGVNQELGWLTPQGIAVAETERAAPAGEG